MGFTVADYTTPATRTAYRVYAQARVAFEQAEARYLDLMATVGPEGAFTAYQVMHHAETRVNDAGCALADAIAQDFPLSPIVEGE